MARIRAVVLEENAHLQLSSNLCEGEGIGVLVGRITSKSCYVLRFVPTPAPAASPVPSRSSSLFPFEDWWVEDHAHQVWDLLPGGISVVGLCLISPSFNEHVAASLKRLTQQLHQSGESLHCLQPHTLLLMHFSTVTASITCQCLSLSGGCAQQVDVVLGSLPAEHWCRLEARVPIQVKALIPLTQDPFLELHQNLANDLEQWLSGTVLFGCNSNYCSRDELLVNYMKDGCIHCTVYPRHKELHCGQSHCMGNATAVMVHGEIATVAYLPTEATVEEASKALSGDVVHTVLVRCRRMYEDLQQQKKHMTSTWCPPQRVQLAVEGWTFCLCAYHFPDETLLDMRERVCEVIGVDKQNVRIVCCEQKQVDLKKSNGNTTYYYGLMWWMASLVVIAAVVTGLYIWTR